MLRDRHGEKGERLTRAAAYAAVGVAVAFTVWLGRPELALAAGAPARTDLGGHIVALRHLVGVSLPSGHLLDWSHQWFAGYASFYFYFPLPALLIAVLSLGAPLNVAAKLVAVAAPGLLPPSVYVLVRTAGFGRLHAVAAVLGAVTFLSLTSYSIYGGNVIGSVIGEYSYALSLPLTLLYLAAVAQAVRGQRRVPHMAVLLAGAALCHVIPTLFAVLASAAALRHRMARRDVVAGWLLGFGVSAFWSVPFLLRSPYMGRVLWERQVDPWMLIPLPVLAVLPWSVAGGVALWRSGVRPGLIAALAGAAAAWYLAPHGIFAQQRGMPIFHLCVYVLAGLGIGTGLARAYRANQRIPLALWAAGLVVLAGLIVLQADVVRQRSAALLASGAPDSVAYRALARTLAALPPGRVHWEFRFDPGGALGDRVALGNLADLAPGVRTSIGLHGESALASPAFVYLLRNLSRDSLGNRLWRLHAPNDTATGRILARMRQLGVAYHVTFSREAQAWAAAQPQALRPVAVDSAWTIWAVTGASLVAPVRAVRPARGAHSAQLAAWLTGASDTAAWLVGDDAFPAAGTLPPPLGGRPLVADARLTHRAVHFRTAAVGVPHVVRVGYFPNWRAYGADGPYRVVPGFMLVVPRQQAVTLRFETTWVEWTGGTLTIASLLLLLLIATGVRPRMPARSARP